MAGRLLHTLPAMSYTIGLATTFHDPAIAIVDPDGEVLFAEAAERYLQYKRAPNCEPDSAPRMEGLLKRYIPEGAEAGALLLVMQVGDQGAFAALGHERTIEGGRELQQRV